MGSMGGGGDARYMIDLFFEAGSRPFQGQLRASSPDTGPGIQDLPEIEIVTKIASSNNKIKLIDYCSKC